MKEKKNKVFLLIGLGMLCLLCGCDRSDEVVFVDADGLQEEADVSASDAINADIAQVQENAGVDSARSQPESEETESAMAVAKIATASDNEGVEASVQKIVVHVCGAVASPGVYELDEGSRIIDAVNRADGLLLTAASDYVNLAAVISDGEKIWIPTAKEVSELEQNPNAFSGITATAGNAFVKEASQTGDSGKVNINTADKELLCTLPGIGNTRAESIIAYRESHGAFSCIEDIMKVSGIKENSFQKIKEYIVIK